MTNEHNARNLMNMNKIEPSLEIEPTLPFASSSEIKINTENT